MKYLHPKFSNLKIPYSFLTIILIPSLLLISILSLIPFSNSHYNHQLSLSPLSPISLSIVTDAYGLFETQKQPLGTYDDSNFNFKIEYPLNWEKSVKINDEITFIAPKDKDSVSSPAGLIIKVIPSSIRDGANSNNNLSTPVKNVSIESAAKSLVAQLKKTHKDFKLDSSKYTSIGGKKAMQIVFTATDNKLQNRKALQIVTINNNNIFIITYKANPDKFTNYESIVKDMLNSFKFKTK